MSRFVRPSKYRHVYGTAAKKEGCLDNVKVSNNAWDTNLVSTNGRYVALNWNASGGGAFAVMPVDRPGKFPDIYPLCRGHTATVLDTAWSPFHEDIVVSGSDDGTLGIWKIDSSMFAILDMTEKEREKAGDVKDIAPLARINTGTRKVGQIVFHPTASGLVAVSTGDHQVRIYDITSIIEGGSDGSNIQPSSVMAGPRDSIQSFDFDYSGDRLAVTSRDKQFRIYDARKGGEPIAQAPGHEGVKGARVIWCGDSDRLITTGFTRTSDRQMFLWNSSDLSKPVKSLTLDTSSGVVMPFWSDNQVIFLAGKGDGNVRYYELEGDELYELAEYKSTEPQRGMTFVPRRTVNANDNEIGKAFKVTGNLIQPISFQVPRRAENFQSDIFPPAASIVPALTGAEFFSGKRATPNLISLENGSNIKGSTGQATSSAATPALSRPVSPVKSAAIPVQDTREEPTYSTKQDLQDSAAATSRHVPITTSNGNRSATATPVVSTPNANTSSPTEMNALREELEILKEEMAKRDTLIRKLEVENERLRANERKVREAVGI
ncbi:putative CRN1 [Meira miltonrushii]|uniref:Coronin n=1 Tax=Meira miltonrushii TaxID=1280837 RepID=A0A316VP37_9BASI|nr:putative CRN1 [Meira miltonrushii]PWN38173.1 putative CRN1 [Meira miltonrushii]